jgi:GTP-binding protein HflX
MNVVEDVLGEIGLDTIERLLVFNKDDLTDPEIVKNLCRRYNAISISAIHTDTLGKLLGVLEQKLWPEEGAGTIGSL